MNHVPTKTQRQIKENSLKTTQRTPSSIYRYGRLILLSLTVCVMWLTIEDRWGSNFQFPTRYMGDSHYILGMMKLAREGNLGLFTHIYTPSLGAPFTGQMNDFPQTERAIVWVGGQIARIIGLMPSANVMLMLSSVIAALSFYSTARLWRASRFSSLIFSVVYAFLPQSQRSLDQLGIGFTGLLPIQFYCCWYIATVQTVSWKSFRFRLTLIIGLLSGLLSIYWVFFFLNIYILAWSCRAIKRRDNLMVSAIPLAATCLVTGLLLVSFIIYRERYGANPYALTRSYLDLEKYSLKPIDLLIPNWGPYFDISSKFLDRYYNNRLPIGAPLWGSYIGCCSILGLLSLFILGIKRQLNRHPPSLPYLATLWIISYTSIGGTHAIISLLLNFYDIRATNRYSASVATIGLLYFTFAVYKLSKNWPTYIKKPTLILIAAIAVKEQSFKTQTFHLDHDFSIQEHVTSDRNLVYLLEKRLEKESMIYILPVMDFPEPISGRGGYNPDFFLYDSMRPFLFSTNLRYSYGSNKGRKGADWQFDVQNLPAGKMVQILESYGFSGILLNRKGYVDHGEHFLDELAEAGRAIEFEQGINNEWIFIRITPSNNPVIPTKKPYSLSIKK